MLFGVTPFLIAVIIIISPACISLLSSLHLPLFISLSWFHIFCLYFSLVYSHLLFLSCVGVSSLECFEKKEFNAALVLALLLSKNYSAHVVIRLISQHNTFSRIYSVHWDIVFKCVPPIYSLSDPKLCLN